jgi:HEAT repeat protein
MTGHRALDAAVFVAGLAIGVACGKDSSALGAERPRRAMPDDTVEIVKLLAVVRGSNPLVCELATRSADMHGSWSSWGPISGDPLVMDSASAALLNWVQRTHDDPTIVPRLRVALQDDDACVRRIGSSLLSRVRHSSAVSALLAALDDQKAGTREEAAFGLGMAEATVAADQLVGRLRDAAPSVRRAAAWALGQLEVKKAVPALIGLLATDSDARVRQTAAWAIGRIR